MKGWACKEGDSALVSFLVSMIIMPVHGTIPIWCLLSFQIVLCIYENMKSMKQCMANIITWHRVSLVVLTIFVIPDVLFHRIVGAMKKNVPQ